MDFNEYRLRGKEMVDYIADYLENIRTRRVFPDVKPGYMRNLLSDSAPLDGEDWPIIFQDIERVIMPGVTHWQSPHMHAYFPALNSVPSLLGDMLADSINCLGFTWASSPACTELEIIVMNWLGKMIGLPDAFLHASSTSSTSSSANGDVNGVGIQTGGGVRGGGGGGGGGVIQTTASEATLVCLLAGRTQAIRRFHENEKTNLEDSEINARLVGYCSDQAHSSVEKAALIGLVRMRFVESDDQLSLRGNALRDAIEEDLKLGLIPFWVCATLGTTGACSFDNLDEIGNVCQEYKIWLHVDAAYAGSSFICPEYRVWLKGIEKTDSIAFNPSKWLMVHFDCTALWVKNSGALHRTFNVEPLYLQHENSGLAIDYMHWQIPLSKRFRALKLWFVIRNYGIKGLQKHIREGVRLAQKFEALILADNRFEIPATRHLGMVVFRIKGENDLTERLLKTLNNRGRLHCVPASLKGKYVIRFTVTSARTTNDDIIKDWMEIRQVASEILEKLNIKIGDRAKVPLKDTREKNEAFGSSLLLANSPMSPKIVNGSFAAIFDTEEFLAKAYAGIRISGQNSPSARRRIRGILMSGKQFSLDSRMDLVFHGIDSGTMTNDSMKNRAITEDNEESWEVSKVASTNSLNYFGLGLQQQNPTKQQHPQTFQNQLQFSQQSPTKEIQQKHHKLETQQNNQHCVTLVGTTDIVENKIIDNAASTLAFTLKNNYNNLNNSNNSNNYINNKYNNNNYNLLDESMRLTENDLLAYSSFEFLNTSSSLDDSPPEEDDEEQCISAYKSQFLISSIQDLCGQIISPSVSKSDSHKENRLMTVDKPYPPISSIKIKISDELGRRIENSLDSGSPDFDLDLFFQESTENNIHHQYDDPVIKHLPDLINITNHNHNNPIIENVNDPIHHIYSIVADDAVNSDQKIFMEKHVSKVQRTLKKQETVNDEEFFNNKLVDSSSASSTEQSKSNSTSRLHNAFTGKCEKCGHRSFKRQFSTSFT